MNRIAGKVYELVKPALPPELRLSVSFWQVHGKWPDLSNPKTFSEKIHHQKLHNRNPMLPVLTDKILAKAYVRKKLGAAWIIPTLWSGKKLPPRSQRKWQAPFVIKANHGSGWNIFIYERVSDWNAIESNCDAWINTSYSPQLLEWAYSRINPHILIEPFIGLRPDPPYDYKFWVFSGRVEYVHVDTDRFRRFFDRNWNAQDFTYGFPLEQRELPKPPHFNEMLRAAEELGTGFPFVRVDFYDENGPRFGEMTFYPESGLATFSPPSLDWKFGALWADTSYPNG